MADLVRLDDGDWLAEPRGWRDVARCLLGRHRPITMAIDRDASVNLALVSRCSCGAIRLGDRYWLDARPWTRRGNCSPR